MAAPLHRFRASRITRAIRSASTLPVVVETAGGSFVAKLHGAAQGFPALIAEIIVAELAEAIGLPVPERALISMDADTPSNDKNDELVDLLRASAGDNLGFCWLEGAVVPRTAEMAALDDAFAVRVLWLDGLVMNPDRTAQNPNLLLWKRQPWLIDHGAALTFQYDWAGLTEASPREPTDSSRHLFASRAGLLAEWDAVLAAALGREVISAAIGQVPDAFLCAAFPGEDLTRLRAGYHAFLWKRLKAPRPFVS
jgi:HipA-like kinase